MDWGNCYRQGDTPWEKGEPHPELPFLLGRFGGLFLKSNHLLVPGCGFGHDVGLISESAGGKIEGLDIAREAVTEAKEKYPRENIAWSCGDLFEWPEGREGAYDMIWEHTCFSAISPERRPDYAAAMSALIRSGGYLLGIFFPNPDHPLTEGPPFHVSVAELHQLFDDSFSLEWSAEPSITYESRDGEGRELSMLWRRR